MIDVNNFLNPIPEIPQAELHRIAQKDLMLRAEAFGILGDPVAVNACAEMAVVEDAVFNRGVKLHNESVILAVNHAGAELHKVAFKARHGVTSFAK